MRFDYKIMRILKGENATAFTFPNSYKRLSSMAILSVGFSKCDSQFKIENQCRSISVIGYVKSGNGYLETKSGTILTSAGDLFILPKNTKHLYYTKKHCNWEFFWFNIMGDFFLELISSYALIDRCLYEGNDMLKLFSISLDFCLNSDNTFEEKHIQLMLYLHEILLRLAHSQQNILNKISQTTLTIKRFIDNNIHKKLSLSIINKKTGIPVHHITNAFRSDLNISPYNYILHKKIDIAKNLLHNSSASVKEIAFTLSFADPYYFSNIFKKKTSLSPLNFRKQTRDII